MSENTDFEMIVLHLNDLNRVEIYHNWSIHRRPIAEPAFDGDYNLYSVTAYDPLATVPTYPLVGYGNSEQEALVDIKTKIDSKGVI